MILKVDSGADTFRTFASGLKQPLGSCLDDQLPGNLLRGQLTAAARYVETMARFTGSIRTGNRSGFASGLYGPEGIAFGQAMGISSWLWKYGSPSKLTSPATLRNSIRAETGRSSRRGLHQPHFIAVAYESPSLRLGCLLRAGHRRAPRAPAVTRRSYVRLQKSATGALRMASANYVRPCPDSAGLAVWRAVDAEFAMLQAEGSGVQYNLTGQINAPARPALRRCWKLNHTVIRPDRLPRGRSSMFALIVHKPVFLLKVGLG